MLVDVAWLNLTMQSEQTLSMSHCLNARALETRSSRSPSPRPSPQGRGRIVLRFSANPQILFARRAGLRVSLHEPCPLTLILSPGGGEETRRGFMVSMGVQSLAVEALHEPGS